MPSANCIRSTLLSLAMLWLAAPALPQEGRRDILVGLGAPLTGPLAEAGKAMSAGAVLAVKQINARNPGFTLSLVIENDEAGTAPARRAAEALVARKVSVVIGHHTSAPTATAAEIYARQGILLIAPAASSPAIAQGRSPLLLRLAPRETAQGLFAGRELATRYPEGALAIIHDSTTQSRALASAAAKGVSERRTDAAMIRDLPSGPEAQQQAAMLARMLVADPPAAIYFAGSASAAAPFLKALRQGGGLMPVIASDALASGEFAAAAGDAVDGLRMVMPAQPQGVSESSSLLVADGVKDMTLALSTYAAFEVLAEALRRAPSGSPEDLAKAMRGGEALRTVIGPVSFDDIGERRELPFVIMRWIRAADGKFIFAAE